MLFDELRQQLSADELSAIEFLESRGFVILTEARLEDCRRKDGSRFRTFSLSGRYDLMMGLKSITDRPFEDDPQAVDPKIEDDPQQPQDAVDDGPQVEGRIIGSNFWMERDQWIRLNRDAFYQLVTEEVLDDLIAAPADVQDEVKDKFLRFFDAKEWPIK